MKNKIIKKFLAKVKEEMHKETISNVTELYQKFIIECNGFGKKLVKLAGKEQAPEISAAIDQMIDIYTDCFLSLRMLILIKDFAEDSCLL